MNILLVVVTFLMVLTLMTYARIESYRDSSAVQAQFECAMQKRAPKYPSAVAKKRYQRTPAEKKKGGIDKDEEQREQDYACSRLSFYLFINKKAREDKPEEFNQLLLLTKILITNLYGEQEFFQKMEEKNPEFLDELMHALMAKTEDLPKGETITYPKDLSNLEFGNDELDTLFYTMLKGTDEEEEGYPSLLDFITIKNKTNIRVYLAPREILNTVYDNADLVTYIEEVREELYKQVKKDKLNAKRATTEFRGQFVGKQRPNISDALLDFTVSKSNPKDYK